MKFASSRISIVLFLLLFVSSAVLQSSNQCPSCYIPCTPQSETDSSLVRTFNHQIEGRSLIIVLDAVTGEANIMYSNRKGSLYFKTMIVDDYEMRELCEIFSAAPTLTHPNSHRNKAVVHFDQFPRQRLSPIDEADPRYLYLFQKSKLLVSKQKRLIDQLNNTVHTHEAFERKIVKKVETLSHSLQTLNSQLSSLKSQFSLQNHNLQYHIKKDETRKKLEYAIANARISGYSYLCRPSTYKPQFPRAARNYDHCGTPYPHWMYIDLAEELTLNRIQIYFYDHDKRVTTATIQISLDKANWITVAYQVSSQQLLDFSLSRLYQVKYIRMLGTNPLHSNLVMHWIKLDWV